MCIRDRINVMRSEMYLDAEKMLQRYPNELIYFLEAPTGSGKSNTALNLSLQLLGTGKKIFYIYPFNTLVDQNKIILQDIFKPVSYTHLDVYKRQPLNWFWLQLFQNILYYY